MTPIQGFKVYPSEFHKLCAYRTVNLTGSKHACVPSSQKCHDHQPSFFRGGQRNQYCTHCEHLSGPVQPKPHGSTKEHQRTAHQDRETHISKKTCVSVPPLQMARPDPISTWDWQCPPGFLAQILLPLCQHISRTQCPFCTLCFLPLNSNNATWKNGNLTSPADFPGARHCVKCHFKD